MREIKFKFWNRLKKHITRPYSLIELSDLGSTRTFPISIPLQSTGLKDKNGKEIYESDIVHFRGYYYGDGYNKRWGNIIGIIEWHTKLYQLVVHCESDTKFAKYRPLNKIYNAVDEYTEKEIIGLEVIGNIYQNPELIKE